MEHIPISHQIQAFVYRHILQIIKNRGCSYEEAWDIFKEELSSLLEKEDESRQQQIPNQQKMDSN